MPNYFGFGSSKSSKKKAASPLSRALCLGLDRSGKTTFLYNLKLAELVSTIPTIGFNVEEISFPPSSKHKIAVWDIGGQDKIRSLWRHYIENTGFFIWAINAAEPERFDESLTEFKKVSVMFPNLDSLVIVFLITHVDAISASDVAEFRARVETEFGLEELRSQAGEDFVGIFEVNACNSVDEGVGDFRRFMAESFTLKNGKKGNNLWGPMKNGDKKTPSGVKEQQQGEILEKNGNDDNNTADDDDE